MTPEQLKEYWRSKKQNERDQKRATDEVNLKAKRAQEKQNERDQKRATDEANLKAKRAEEKQNERDQKRIHRVARLALFKNHTRDERIFECICCHRRLFEPGVLKIGDIKIFKKKLNKKFPGLFKRAIKKIVT